MIAKLAVEEWLSDQKASRKLLKYTIASIALHLGLHLSSQRMESGETKILWKAGLASKVKSSEG